MARPFPLEPNRLALESQIRECFGRCAYTHKTHEKMAERGAARLACVKWVQIVLAALTTGGAIGVIFTRETTYFAYGTAILSIGSLIFNSYLKDLDPGTLSQRHRETASDIWNVREAYLIPVREMADSSGHFADWYRARGWPVAARKAKTHTCPR